jgi:hypothetical protein
MGISSLSSARALSTVVPRNLLLLLSKASSSEVGLRSMFDEARRRCVEFGPPLGMCVCWVVDWEWRGETWLSYSSVKVVELSMAFDAIVARASAVPRLFDRTPARLRAQLGAKPVLSWTERCTDCRDFGRRLRARPSRWSGRGTNSKQIPLGLSALLQLRMAGERCKISSVTPIIIC